MTALPEGMTGTLRHALAFNLLDYHRRYGEENLPDSDLYADLITALCWLLEHDRDTALHVIQQALREAAAVDQDGPSLDAVSRCLRHSLTQGHRYTREHAERIVTAALLLT